MGNSSRLGIIGCWVTFDDCGLEINWALRSLQSHSYTRWTG